jgi:hypothetical protein
MLRLTLFAFALALPTAGFAQEEKKKELPEKARKAVQAVQDYLAKLRSQGGTVDWKDHANVLATFPDHAFVVARYRLFPIARELPEGMGAANIFVVDKDNKALRLKDAKELEKFFKTHVKVGDKKDAAAALGAWLSLSQEFHQDGMFKFEVLGKDFAGEEDSGKHTVRGRALVTQGGNGELAATVVFDGGKLVSVKESAGLRPGPRPICQATLLLDPNPLVRRIAEQDLLIMGLAARDYLMEQRAQAIPELQSAIDALWLKMQKNGW